MQDHAYSNYASNQGGVLDFTIFWDWLVNRLIEIYQGSICWDVPINRGARACASKVLVLNREWGRDGISPGGNAALANKGTNGPQGAVPS